MTTAFARRPGIVRTVAAFTAALVSAIVVFALMPRIWQGRWAGLTLTDFAMIGIWAAPVVAVFGMPIRWLMRRLRVDSAAGFFLAGVMAAGIALLTVFAAFSPTARVFFGTVHYMGMTPLSSWVLLSGGIGGLVFRAIVRE